ncbi:MAG TPA: flagellar biosynthetic protein FliO [Rubrivivax sp.]|nr:flagellar biosynthetic protein FliO [Rubrivivax sp.]HOW47193.1 flagellar biosynthetic protein FliO [Rubrivivax sp.]HRY86920.1 flagellar biosynthetic protein FliO [Rubrivivax sp.]HRZ60717.1 flagellar biosynthetic protein FliO [Rubrivivax sp.]
MPATPGWSSLLWFGAVVALIPLALWLLKRTPLAGAGGGLLRAVAVLPLSASQRVAIVEVGSGAQRRWLVLGVSAQGIQRLATLEPLAEAEARGDADGGFAQLLARLKREP